MLILLGLSGIKGKVGLTPRTAYTDVAALYDAPSKALVIQVTANYARVRAVLRLG